MQKRRPLKDRLRRLDLTARDALPEASRTPMPRSADQVRAAAMSDELLFMFLGPDNHEWEFAT